MEIENGDNGFSQVGWRPKIDQSARYCIRVVGELDPSWSERLGGLQISTFGQDKESPVTTLTGALIDQAALFGVLKSLYDLRMPLLSVECLGDR